MIAVDEHGTPHSVQDTNKPTFKTYAKQRGERHMVLASSDGDLFDPMNSGHNVHQRDSERGGLFWKLRKCSKECYDQYTAFLRSKNRTPLMMAQRRFRNDF